MKWTYIARGFLSVAVLGMALVACGTTPAAQQPTAAPATAAVATSMPSATTEPTLAPAVAEPTAGAERPTAAPTVALATAVPVEATQAAPMPTPTFAAPTDETLPIAKAALAAVKGAGAGSPVVAGVTGVESDYAAVLALPFGQRPQYVYLQRKGGAWTVLQATSMPSSLALEQLGVPESLMSASDASAVMDAWMAQLQDPRGQGVEGSIVVEGVAGDYARVSFAPANPTKQDGFTAFLKRESDSWKQLTGGTAFDEGTLRQLGIPKELWG